MKDVIVVTGASSGLGKEFVLQIANKEKVDEIWVIARRIDRLVALGNEVNVKIVPIEIDLSNGEQIDKYKQKLEEDQPNVKILANCAGFGKFEHYENIPLQTHLNMIDLNCKANLYMIDYTLPYMHEDSKIMNIVSCASFQPLPYINVYGATKSFMLSYSRALNRELAYRKIHVLAVCPYWVQTEFFDRAIKPEAKPVVINYGVMYQAKEVIKKAIRDLYGKKDISVYGKTNKLQWLGAKLFPHRMVMRIWEKRQKFDGTRDIRK